MKKIIIAILGLIAVQSVSGQSLVKGILNRLSYGVKAGGNYSNFTNANFETNGLIGFNAGFLVDFKITNALSIQEDFLYSIQGAKVASDSFAGKQDLKLSYLSVPIVMKYRTRIGIYFEAGVQTSMLLSDAKNTGFAEYANKLDAAVVGGIGYHLRLGSSTKSIGIGARYCQGLTDVGKFNSPPLGSNFKNNLGQLSVFYIF